VLQSSPLKKSCPKIIKEEGPSETKNGPGGHFFGLSNTKVGVITFLIPRSGSCLLSVRSCRRNKLLGGISFDDHSLAKSMKDGCTKALVKPQVQGLMITKAQGVHLVRVMDTPVILSHNERTSDKHGNACVQEGLTSR
jgi:hypothetical protein